MCVCIHVWVAGPKAGCVYVSAYQYVCVHVVGLRKAASLHVWHTLCGRHMFMKGTNSREHFKQIYWSVTAHVESHKSIECTWKKKHSILAQRHFHSTKVNVDWNKRHIDQHTSWQVQIAGTLSCIAHARACIPLVWVSNHKLMWCTLQLLVRSPHRQPWCLQRLTENFHTCVAEPARHDRHLEIIVSGEVILHLEIILLCKYKPAHGGAAAVTWLMAHGPEPTKRKPSAERLEPPALVMGMGSKLRNKLRIAPTKYSVWGAGWTGADKKHIRLTWRRETHTILCCKDPLRKREIESNRIPTSILVQLGWLEQLRIAVHMLARPHTICLAFSVRSARISVNECAQYENHPNYACRKSKNTRRDKNKGAKIINKKRKTSCLFEVPFFCCAPYWGAPQIGLLASKDNQGLTHSRAKRLATHSNETWNIPARWLGPESRQSRRVEAEQSPAGSSFFWIAAKGSGQRRLHASPTHWIGVTDFWYTCKCM